MSGRTFTLLRAALPLTCASCGVRISWRYAAADFTCPACGCGLRLRRRYFKALSLASLAIAVLVSYAIGLRDDALLAASVLALLPVNYVVTLLNMRLFPPEVEISGDYRGILHNAPQDPSLPPEPLILGAVKDKSSTDEKSTDSGFRRFTLPALLRTFEGVAMAAAVIALVGSWAYMAVEPSIDKLLPELRATKRGPSAFPATVYIGVDTLRVTNGSSANWSCSIVLGVWRSHRASLTVGAGAGVELRYEDFQADGRDTARDADARRRAARQEIDLDCVEPSGRTHFWVFK